jgi:hypothetical protein
LYCPAGSLFDIMKRDGRPAMPHNSTLVGNVTTPVRPAQVFHSRLRMSKVTAV